MKSPDDIPHAPAVSASVSKTSIADVSALVAGGGFQGGRVLGATDAHGEEVDERPVHPRELLATMYALLGIDPEGPLPNPRGLDVQVLPAEAGDKGPGRLKELL